ncbi:WD40/YVTN/BNR-like repeat-containing protein [Halorarum halobium]|uniref:WD40/YVTN/BNR-like repeat-containing protein n=1 Tax=Halorarum halobium TaxID=3075121 RepID=UPI0028B10F8C|nr:hypothetical protein [Halobaculum sp. XH14]
MSTAYAAMRDRFLAVDLDTGSVPTTSLDGRSLECVAVHPASPERVFVGTFESGLHRSTDGGESFERVDDVPHDAVMSAAVSPHDTDVVWAGTEPSRVYRSTDGGGSWEHLDGLVDLPSSGSWSFPPRPQTHHVRWLEPDPADPDHWYVAIEAGALVQTHDRGATWEDRVPDSRVDNHTLATHPDAPGRAWVAAGDGYAETDDAGETWRHPQTGLDRTYCWSVAVDAGGDRDHELVLVSAARGAYEAHTASRAETYVYRREGDADWERLDGRGLPLGEGVTRPVLARGPAGGSDERGEFYALSNRGLFRTVDAGDSWTAVKTDWSDRFADQTARGLAVVP